MRLKTRLSSERGAVLLTVALVMTVLTLLVAGGISTFTLFGAQRELQKAADQAALAAAAALPPVDPDPLLDLLPLPGTSSEIPVVGPVSGLDVPLKDLVPDPRAVGCGLGAQSLAGDSALLINSFGTTPTSPPSPPCPNDPRISVSFTGGISACVDGIVNGLVNRLTALVPGNLLPSLLASVTAPLTELQRNLQLLAAVAPGVATPNVTVTVKSGLEPPLLSMITGSDGVQMQATATAHRRIKNVVALPGDDLAGINLNSVAAMPRAAVLESLSAIDSQVNNLTQALQLGECHVINDLRTDVADVYNPGGSSPTVTEVIEAAAEATEQAASRSGTAVDDLAGEAFLLVANADDPTSMGGLVPPLLRPVLQLVAPSALTLLNGLQVPALDVAIVAAHNLSDGSVDPSDIMDAVQARGLFRATLVN